MKKARIAKSPINVKYINYAEEDMKHLTIQSARNITSYIYMSLERPRNHTWKNSIDRLLSASISCYLPYLFPFSAFFAHYYLPYILANYFPRYSFQLYFFSSCPLTTHFLFVRHIIITYFNHRYNIMN